MAIAMTIGWVNLFRKCLPHVAFSNIEGTCASLAMRESGTHRFLWTLSPKVLGPHGC